jgi:hypothetical protein
VGKGAWNGTRLVLKWVFFKLQVENVNKDHFASRALFQITLEYVYTINMYYRQENLQIYVRAPNGLTHAIAKVIIETMNTIMQWWVC